MSLDYGDISEKYIVRLFCCVNIIECTYTNLVVIATTHVGRMAWYGLLLLGYKTVQHVTILNTKSNCNNGIYLCI